MKHHFFDNHNVAFNPQGANGPAAAYAPAAINFGGGDKLGGNVPGNLVFFGGGAQVIGPIGFAQADPIVEGAIATINNPETTSLDLSNTNLNNSQLQIICQHLQNNQNIEFIDLSNNHITPLGLLNFINAHHNIVSANFSGCQMNLDQAQDLVTMELNIYQSPLINFTFGDTNLLAQRKEDASVIMNVLYKMLSSFDLDSSQERETLIKFIFSPKAQKALKWLSQNSEDLDLQVVGEQFVFLLNRMAKENIFYLKAVCKELNTDSDFFSLAHETFSEILSSLSLQDIILSTTATGPVIEEVNVLGNSSSTNPFQSTDGDDDLYS